jgi:YegS/Rv2252/BmrU family lipid kinase
MASHDSEQSGSELTIPSENSDQKHRKSEENPSTIEAYEKAGKLPKSISTPSGGKVIEVKRVLLLCNGHSGSGKGKKIGKKSKKLFKKAKVQAELKFLEHPGHAEEICKCDDLSKYDVICCIGGDGTFHEAANGMLKSKNSKKPLAIIPAGTGNSFCYELGIGTHVKRAVRHVLRGVICPIDVIQLHFNDSDKEDIFSANSIHWGVASRVLVTAERLRWMGHSFRYTTAALYELVKGERRTAKIKVVTEDDKEHTYEGEFCMVIANNIMTAGKRRKLAPEARLNDGLVDLLILRTSRTFDLLSALSKVSSGRHTDLDYVSYTKVKEFSITSYEEDTELLEEVLDIDGELKGITPFTAKVIPQAMDIVV